MKKQVYIIGAGMTEADLTAHAVQVLQAADCIVGAPRLLQPFREKKPCIKGYTAETVEKALEQYDSAAVLVSGDVGFYSGAASLYEKFPEAEVIPGISSVNAFFAACRLPWQEAALVSAHGKDCCPAESVRRNALTFFLTGGNIPQLAGALSEAGFAELSVTAGENLGTREQKLTECRVQDLLEGNRFASLTVLLVRNPHPDTRNRVGIADSEFIRGEVPMTKSAVRAQIASALQLSESSCCWDVGCGTGSVTVEMALAAHRGRVFACDLSEEAVKLTKQNCSRFHISNGSVQKGRAPDCLAELPAPDAVFIGGSSGSVKEITEAALAKNPQAVIVVTAIALETLQKGTEAMEELGLSPEVRQIFAAETKCAGKLHLLTGGNPTFIIRGKREA
ncbi:MAG: precorrin-6y C5,15-methyltransferase (decarboxylating) subunit CbiE [Lachnospiraceae bacterium]|nr:precorrin-6y C5,15-methyltransferase (decarboxylating) subunit CbiE [Lachnospiraceae bacterium]